MSDISGTHTSVRCSITTICSIVQMDLNLRFVDFYSTEITVFDFCKTNCHAVTVDIKEKGYDFTSADMT